MNWTPQRDAFVSSYCNTIPTPEGGTHEAGFWAAILRGIRGYGELASNRKAAAITREDVMAGGSAMISVFIREPEFVGQTKDRLASQEAARLVEAAVRDRFDHWLAADTRTAGAILDYLVLKAEDILDLQEERGQALAAELGGHTTFVRTDVTDEASVQAAIADATGQGPAAAYRDQLRGHRLGAAHGRPQRRPARPRRVHEDGHGQPGRHLQRAAAGRRRDGDAPSRARTASAASSSTPPRSRPTTGRSARSPTRRPRAASSA